MNEKIPTEAKQDIHAFVLGRYPAFCFPFFAWCRHVPELLCAVE